MINTFKRSMLLISVVISNFAPMKIGLFEKSVDVGNPKIPGSAAYDARSKEYTLTGSGYNIWFERDEFQYLYKEIQGDFTATADFEFVGTGKDPHRKVGWMVRESLEGNASHVSAVVHGDGLTVLQWRVAKGEKMRDPEDEIFSKEKQSYTVQMERKGQEYTMRVAPKGGKLEEVGKHEMKNLSAGTFLGLYICSHNPAVTEQARVRNVKIQQ